jgi:hypothetical protein
MGECAASLKIFAAASRPALVNSACAALCVTLYATISSTTPKNANFRVRIFLSLSARANISVASIRSVLASRLPCSQYIIGAFAANSA